MVFQTGLPLEDPALVRAAARLVAFTLAAATVAAVSAIGYRWYTREPIPTELALLFGLGIVAVYLNTEGLFGQVLAGTAPSLFELRAVVFNVVAFGIAAAATPLGRAVGDGVATNVFAVAGGREIEADVSRLVRTVGRVTTVTLPADIDDIEGYDPVTDAQKAEMAGKTLLFPRRLTVVELQDRLSTRLKDDYRVGHVDVELDDDGTVAYLAVGSRAAGIGPTLGPGTVAVAVHADPAHGASAGDVVQVWRPDPLERVVTGELRGTADDIVTIAVDAAEAEALDAHTEYRLVTLPTTPQADREFASLLRSATETMGTVTVGAESPLVGELLGSLDVTVAAVQTDDGTIDAIPSRRRTVTAGETLFVVALPEALRRLEARATSTTTATDGATAE